VIDALLQHVPVLLSWQAVQSDDALPKGFRQMQHVRSGYAPALKFVGGPFQY